MSCFGRTMTWIAAIALTAGAVSLPACMPISPCITGASLECACPGGGKGAQVCLANGTLAPCDCGSGGSGGGTTGAGGGSTGLGGGSTGPGGGSSGVGGVSSGAGGGSSGVGGGSSGVGGGNSGV